MGGIVITRLYLSFSINTAYYEKVIFYLLIGIFSVTLVSCDSDKDESTPSNTVVGVWRHDFGDGYQLLTLEKGGRYSLVEFDFVSGNWSEYGTYSVKDNIMTRVLSDGDVEVYTILTLTQSKMITRYEGSYLGQYPNQYDEDVEDWTRVE